MATPGTGKDLSITKKLDKCFDKIERIRETCFEEQAFFRKLELEEKKNALKLRRFERKTFPINLLEKKKQFPKYDIKDACCQLINVFKEKLKTDLMYLLKCESEKVVHDSHATKETYRVYGLLLSACNFKKNKDEKCFSRINNEVFNDDRLTNYRHVSFIKDHIYQAVVMTYDMLTLLPPLIVCQPQKYHGEDVHDTHRQTWDENDKDAKLVYYRPVLVYGNHLHVAVPGHVGHEKELKTDGAKGASAGRFERQSSLELTSRNKQFYESPQEMKSKYSNKRNEHKQIKEFIENNEDKCWVKSCTIGYQTKEITILCENGSIEIHKDCFKCHHCPPYKKLDPKTPDLTFYCGHIYCPDHKTKIKCSICVEKNLKNCSIDLNGRCQNCRRSLKKDIFEVS